MTQQSAMNQMINHLEEMKSKTTDQSEIYMLTIAWVKAIHLMQVEKEQIMKAVDRGFDEGCKFPEDMSLSNSEQYYNETYKL